MSLTPHPLAASLLATALALWASPLFARPLAPPPVTGTEGEEIACEGGVIVDDGSAETGYGWVPSVIEGEFVQQFHTSQFPTRKLESVCVCWIRTQPDTEINFEVIFYGDDDGMPASSPYAVVPASATVEPQGIVGTFSEIDVRGVKLPVGRSYIGARWDASVDRFFFVCTDTSEETAVVNVFFRDDRSEGIWTSVLESSDPIFNEHRALMVRARSSFETVVDVPALGASGLVFLAALLAVSGALAARRQSQCNATIGSRSAARRAGR